MEVHDLTGDDVIEPPAQILALREILCDMGSATYRVEDFLYYLTACRRGNDEKGKMLKGAINDVAKREKAGGDLYDIKGSEAATEQLITKMQQEGHILQDAIRIAKEAENRFLEYLVSTCDARLHEQAAKGFAAGSKTWTRISSLLNPDECKKKGGLNRFVTQTQMGKKGNKAEGTGGTGFG
ncbi:hypothetical protein B484DRAFT_410277, partial [Ochromonadaceae sp. CCMP2298]